MNRLERVEKRVEKYEGGIPVRVGEFHVEDVRALLAVVEAANRHWIWCGVDDAAATQTLDELQQVARMLLQENHVDL